MEKKYLVGYWSLSYIFVGFNKPLSNPMINYYSYVIISKYNLLNVAGQKVPLCSHFGII